MDRLDSIVTEKKPRTADALPKGTTTVVLPPALEIQLFAFMIYQRALMEVSVVERR